MAMSKHINICRVKKEGGHWQYPVGFGYYSYIYIYNDENYDIHITGFFNY